MLQSLDYVNFTVDDVFIPIRYAMNAAHGSGLVYNVNDAVEGYSDPLWVFALSGIAKLSSGCTNSGTILLWSAKTMSFLFGMLTLVTQYRFTKRIFEGSPRRSLYAVFSLLALAICAPFIAWSVGGLETTLVAFLYLLLAFIVFEIFRATNGQRVIPRKHFISILIVLLLATITRPEPAMLCVMVLSFLLITLPRLERKPLIIWTIVPYLAGLFLFLTWRWTTYHELLPNTFYAKTGGGISGYINGVKYVCASIALLAAPFLIMFPFAFSEKRSKDPFMLFLTLMIGFECFFAIFAKGDWMPGARFLIPVAPLLVLIGITGLANVLNKLSETSAPLLSTKVVVGTALFVGILFAMAGRTTLRGESSGMLPGFVSLKGHSLLSHEQVGTWLASHVQQNSTVALSEAGLVGVMIPNTHILDLNGLMDSHIARARHNNTAFNVHYVLDHKPDFIVLHNDPTSPILESLATDPRAALGKDSLFQVTYSLVEQYPQFEIYARKQ